MWASLQVFDHPLCQMRLESKNTPNRLLKNKQQYMAIYEQHGSWCSRTRMKKRMHVIV